MYNTCPDFSEIVWKVTSVVLAFVAVFGIVSNLIIVAAFIRNNSVSLQNQLLPKKRLLDRSDITNYIRYTGFVF